MVCRLFKVVFSVIDWFSSFNLNAITTSSLHHKLGSDDITRHVNDNQANRWTVAQRIFFLNTSKSIRGRQYFSKSFLKAKATADLINDWVWVTHHLTSGFHSLHLVDKGKSIQRSTLCILQPKANCCGIWKQKWRYRLNLPSFIWFNSLRTWLLVPGGQDCHCEGTFIDYICDILTVIEGTVVDEIGIKHAAATREQRSATCGSLTTCSLFDYR